MAILRSTQINGDLSVTGSLNVQGDLTYVGVENLCVKDKQIELNINDKGSAALTGISADQAGIVIRGAQNTTKDSNSEEASILYNYEDDTLVINKTIKGTVSNATTAASANKVANPLTVKVTDKTGTVKTVKFDGSAAETVDVNLKELQDQIDGKAAKSHTHATSEITGLDAALAGKQDALANAATLATIDSTKVSNWDNAASKAHVHDNKTVLDGITAEQVAAWDGAVSAAGVSSVGGKAGALTLKGDSATLGDVNLSISDTGEISAAIVADSFDAKGDAAKALADAKTYANGLAKNYDAAGAAAAVKSEVIGSNGDAADKDTIYGAKKYADGLNTAMDGRVKVLEAINHEELAASASAAAVAQVVANAPSDFDTLREVADWIQNDTTGAAALQTDVAGLKTKVSTLESASHTHDNKAELDKIAVGDKAKWDGHVTNADIHVTAEQKTAWSAKQDALTETQLAAVNSGITAEIVTSYGNHIANDNIHVTTTDKDNWNAAEQNAKDYAAGLAKNYDVAGAAAAVKTELIGTDSDTADSATIKGAKKYADGKVAELNTTVNSLSSDVLKGVAAGDYVSVSAKSNNSQTISVKTKGVAAASNTADGNGLALAADVKKYVDDQNTTQNTSIQNNYVKKAGDTMTGDLTMPRSDNKGIVFGDMKIVWNDTDKAIEFVPTTPTTA